MKVIKVKKLNTNEVVHEVEVTGRSERSIDKLAGDMMRKLDYANYWIDSTCAEEKTRPLVRGDLIKCPHCKSTKVTKAGTAWRAQKKIQRYRCQDCGKLFSEK